MNGKILFTLTLLFGVSHCERLNRHVRHYELLSYNTHELHAKHERSRRSVDALQEVELDFEAHGRPFQLRLRQGAPYIAHNLILETDDGAAPYKPDFLYIGNLKDKPKSKVHGGITNGMFQGVIYDEDDEYHIEQAKYHLDEASLPDAESHSVIYKASDVTHPDNGGCGLNDRVSKWMNKIQNSRVDNDNKREKREANVNWQNVAHGASENKYTAPERTRRAVYNSENKACSLYLQADHTYTAHYSNDVSEVILNLNNHVSAINAIYIDTEFAHPNYETIRDINFFIKRIRVCNRLPLSVCLSLSLFCLSIFVFPHQGTSGGICEKSSNFQGVYQSLNTGVVTIQNYGSTVASKVSHITFAHELGHNFGSPHDYPERCRPGDNPNTRSDGNYIMYASATSGDKRFNDEFSDCSIANMTAVIRENGGCFDRSDLPICGNLIVDGEEECDCGYEDQCDDQCCTAATCMLTPNAMQCSPSQGPCCTLGCQFANVTLCRAQSECSISSYCTGYMAGCPASQPKADGTECNEHTQVCEAGVSFSCFSLLPFRVMRVSDLTQNVAEDKEPWRKATKDIKHPMMMMKGFNQKIQNSETILDLKISLNQLGPATCLSSRDIGVMQDHVRMYGKDAQEGTTDVKVLYQMPGAPCNEYQGYCDVFYKCRNVDSNGPLSRLTNAILNPELYSNIAAWIQANWWAAVLIVLGVIIFMGLFIKCCSVHTPSSNPNLPKARSVPGAATLRRRRSQAGARPAHSDIPMA
eukprot:XP_011660729.1 PREDICTED: disintegrin and metalloproteinase domain-containing protein 10 [Strongylocentrotus purpuratus]